MINFNLPSPLKYVLRTVVLVAFAFSFMRGCDPTVSLPFKIENQTSAEIEVMLYGLGQAWTSKKDSLRILEQGEVFRVYAEEQMGTSPGPSNHDSVYFADSIRITHLGKNMITTRNCMDMKEWEFIKGQQKLTVKEEDFQQSLSSDTF